jgi:hypothetical protein
MMRGGGQTQAKPNATVSVRNKQLQPLQPIPPVSESLKIYIFNI